MMFADKNSNKAIIYRKLKDAQALSHNEEREDSEFS